MNFIEKNTKKVALILGIATALSAVTTVYAASNTDGWHDGVYLVEGHAKTEWLFEETGAVYYLNDEGRPVKGWKTIEESTYFFDANGERVSGDVVIDGHKYSFQKNGKLLLGWQDERTSYYNQYGIKLTGKQVIDGKTYNFDQNGFITTGWIKLDGKKVFFTEDGSMATKKTKINGKNYHFDKKGHLVNGWMKKDGEKYYYRDGIQQTGWQKIKGKKYFFNKKGQALTDTEYKGYKFDKNGVAKKIEKKKEVVEEPNYENNYQSSNQYTGNALGGIANGALSQLGVNQDCTALATNALASQGIYFHGWPADYMSLGSITSAPQAGDLIYYDNAGAGVPHIAVYIGNGQAVHGGWQGTTVVASAYIGTGPVFIRVAH